MIYVPGIDLWYSAPHIPYARVVVHEASDELFIFLVKIWALFIFTIFFLLQFFCRGELRECVGGLTARFTHTAARPELNKQAFTKFEHKM